MESEKAPETLDILGIIARFLKSLRRLWILVLILPVLLGGLNYFRLKRSYVPMYEAKAVFSVSSGYGADDVFSSSYYYNNAAASDLAAAFPHLLNTDMMRDQIMAHLGTGYINGSITSSAVADTNLFELRVRSRSAQDAYDILVAVIECYPKVAMIMVENPNVAMRQEPTLPTAPYNSFSGTNALTKGAAYGLVGGLGLTFLVSLLNTTFLSPEDVKKAINLPLLATIPHVDAKKRRKKSNGFLTAADDRGLAEALRGLRTKVRKQLADKGGKVVLVTSTVPGEGKSTMAINLAITLAQADSKVLLVDADMRNPVLRKYMKLKQENETGLSALLNGDVKIADCLIRTEHGVDVIANGPTPPSPAELIKSDAMHSLLKGAEGHYDYIIFDTPPVGIVTDAAALSPLCDGVLYVVRHKYASRGQVRAAIKKLKMVDAKILGTVMTLYEIPKAQGRYGYGYYHKRYRYKYGEY